MTSIQERRKAKRYRVLDGGSVFLFPDIVAVVLSYNSVELHSHEAKCIKMTINKSICG